MDEHNHSFTCPICNGSVGAATEAETIALAQKHAKEHHDKDLPEVRIREMMAEQATQK